MPHAMRQPTLQTLGLGSVLQIFQEGRLPAEAGELVEQVFGKPDRRGALVITGANGIVGSGKAMQLGSRLEPYGVPVVALDFPGSPQGLAQQYAGLVRSFGKDHAARIMGNIVQMTYDGTRLPARLSEYRPRFLLEAIPEVLALKRAHYQVFRNAFPEIEIRSVTSGFPAHQLGVGIAHPAFPHEINKVWEVVEPSPSPVTRLLWALGLIPMKVSDHWSFVLDVMFCGVTLAALRYHEATNMPFWKIDKYVRRLLGPNPFRAHDAIGAKGANFLTWSCLHHLSAEYGDLFEPAASLVERKESGQNWYPPNHFRPAVQWSLDNEEAEEFPDWILGPLFQMASLVLQEERSHLSQINAICEICAQFRPGILAVIRRHGAEVATHKVESYHRLYPRAAAGPWYPQALDRIETPEWRQLYVNAEHDGAVGVVTFGRESYSQDVDAELNRAIDWLKSERIEHVIATADFHLAGQLSGADISDFFPALEDAGHGVGVSRRWSQTARRLHDEFAVSVGFIQGKRCLGGFLELLLHCHFVVAVETAELGFPEVTLPVVPGMEGCHWPFRKAAPEHWQKLLALILEGRPVKASGAAPWLIDYSGPLRSALETCWSIARGQGTIVRRSVSQGILRGVTDDLSGLRPAAGPGMEAGRRAILETIRDACAAPLSEALEIQAKHSGAFMSSAAFRNGAIGAAGVKTLAV